LHLFAFFITNSLQTKISSQFVSDDEKNKALASLHKQLHKLESITLCLYKISPSVCTNQDNGGKITTKQITQCNNYHLNKMLEGQQKQITLSNNLKSIKQLKR
jgi:hypothetical protein